MSKITSFFKATLPITTAATLLAFVLAIQLPLEIYINNASEFSISLSSLIYTFSIAFVAVFLVAFLPALIPFPAFRERYFCFLATLGLLIWFNAHFLFGNYGVLDGRGLAIEMFSTKSIAEIIIAIILLASSIIFSKRIMKSLYQATILLLILVIATTGYELIRYNWSKASTEHITFNNSEPNKRIHEAFLTLSNRSNIIHIVLDEHQSTMAEELFKRDPAFANQLEGFTFFPNTSANYPLTMLAVPAMLSGKIYLNDQNLNNFTNTALHDNPFITALEDADYNTYFHTPAAYCGEKRLTNCSAFRPLSSSVSAVTLLDYSLFKTAPDMLKPKIYREEDWLISRHFINPDYAASFSGAGYLDFAYLNENVVVADVPPTYRYFHTLISHSPVVLDRECNLRTKRVSRHALDPRIEHSECSFSQVFIFLETLKRANVYDNSLIIISSDHGGRYRIPEQEKYLREQQIDSKRFSAALGTLMIKPFNATGSMQVSTVPAALNDIPNTILGNLDLPLLPDGENVFTLTEGSQRSRTYVSYDSNGNWDLEELPPISVYSITGDVRDPRDWTLVCTDDDSPDIPKGYARCNK